MMDAATLAGLCAVLLAHGTGSTPSRAANCLPAGVEATARFERADLRRRVDRPGAREGIARVAYAEAGNQGDSGLAAVVYTILNRLRDGRWGRSVDEVLDGPGQFEPVMRAGGHWRDLARATPAQQARIDTILNLVLDGRLPDLTGGARYFQNPAVVAARARAGTVPTALVDFGGSAPSAVIGAHSFYVAAGHGARLRSGARVGTGVSGLFVGENRAGDTAAAADGGPPSAGREGGPNQAMFVRPDGRVVGP